MKLNFVSAGYTATCRRCSREHHKAVTVYPDPGIPLGDAIELAMHADIEAAGWTDGLCPECGEAEFLNVNVGASADNKTPPKESTL